MQTLHPNDKLAALDWAISQARSAASNDAWVKQTILPVLQQIGDQVQKNVRDSKSQASDETL